MMRCGSRRPGARTLHVLLLAGLLAGCGSKVPIPADSAPPEVVLETHLKALVAGDCETVSALTASGGGGLCGAVRVSGYTGPEAGTTPGGTVYSSILTTSGDDGSMPDGDNVWHYWLTQQPDGAWRVTGEGNG